jgi:hypothetical protein
MTEKELQELLSKNPALKVAGVTTITAPIKENAVQGNSERLKQTKCETEYGRLLALEFPGCEIVPWGLTLRLANNHKYTPDFVVKNSEGIKLICEVKQRGRGKNGYRQPSYQRAKVMFDQSRVEYPFWKWRFIEKHDGIWNEHKF